mmetsp:Transcript_47176/g.78101  ORF Transcript_47176/g.78101 Transcript_47176/m.78101 type:complete len:221 (-) Transcript_47176:111-773(-)
MNWPQCVVDWLVMRLYWGPFQLIKLIEWIACIVGVPLRRRREPTQVEGWRVIKLMQRGLLPVLALPKIDLRYGNGIKRLYVAEFEGGVELTVVFWDEDRPNPLLSILYDMFRAVLFARIEDVETFHITCDEVGNPSFIEFHGTYSGKAPYYARLPQHCSRAVPFEDFPLLQSCTSDSVSDEQNMPVVWVNTWNHAFGESNNNPQAAKRLRARVTFSITIQ